MLHKLHIFLVVTTIAAGLQFAGTVCTKASSRLSTRPTFTVKKTVAQMLLTHYSILKNAFHGSSHVSFCRGMSTDYLCSYRYTR